MLNGDGCPGVVGDFNIRHIMGYVLLQVDLPFLYQLHDRRRGYRFGYRGHAEQGSIGVNLFLGFKVGIAVAVFSDLVVFTTTTSAPASMSETWGLAK